MTRQNNVSCLIPSFNLIAEEVGLGYDEVEGVDEFGNILVLRLLEQTKKTFEHLFLAHINDFFAPLELVAILIDAEDRTFDLSFICSRIEDDENGFAILVPQDVGGTRSHLLERGFAIGILDNLECEFLARHLDKIQVVNAAKGAFRIAFLDIGLDGCCKGAIGGRWYTSSLDKFDKVGSIGSAQRHGIVG